MHELGLLASSHIVVIVENNPTQRKPAILVLQEYHYPMDSFLMAATL